MRIKSQMEIDLSLFAENFEKLKKIAPNNEVLFMVKANAYGHGMVPIVQFAYEELGIKEFGCASLGEAIHLRDKVPDGEFEIYVFSDVQLELKEATETYLNRRIIPVISNESDLDYFLETNEFKHFPLCLKFNTGMNRLGIDDSRVEEVIQKLKHKNRNEVYHLLSHFSSASFSMFKNKKNIDQQRRFKNLKSRFLEADINLLKTSIANSGAIEQGIGLDETHIRPGLMMYGPTSLYPQIRERSKWDGKLISSFSTVVVERFSVSKGTPIGYGATPCFANGVVVIIAVGYGDGFSTRYQGVELKHKGRIGKVVGRVNMDMTQVLFEDALEEDFIVGEKFVVWDYEGESFMNICDQSKTIPYEAFTQITSRIPKVYVTGRQ